jgi:hypothetical protein
VKHPVWREDGSVVYNCCWPLPGPSPAGLMNKFYSLKFETPPTWRARFPYLYPPGTGFHFRRLLRLAGLAGLLLPWRWRRYVPPKRRLTKYLYGATSQKTVFFKYTYLRITALNARQVCLVCRFSMLGCIPQESMFSDEILKILEYN